MATDRDALSRSLRLAADAAHDAGNELISEWMNLPAIIDQSTRDRLHLAMVEASHRLLAAINAVDRVYDALGEARPPWEGPA